MENWGCESGGGCAKDDNERIVRGVSVSGKEVTDAGRLHGPISRRALKILR